MSRDFQGSRHYSGRRPRAYKRELKKFLTPADRMAMETRRRHDLLARRLERREGYCPERPRGIEPH